jgi:hypothetical protein
MLRRIIQVKHLHFLNLYACSPQPHKWYRSGTSYGVRFRYCIIGRYLAVMINLTMTVTEDCQNEKRRSFRI